MSYKAFISYSHAADNQLAPTLQASLQKFAKPFYRLRAINVFRDKTSLHLTPKLWPLIQQALGESEYFLLLASPDAARSQWVQAEVDEWLKIKNGSLDKFLIVLTDGEIFWDRSRNDFDWNKTTALPLSLQSKFATEPLFSDLRWAKKNTDLSLRHPQFLDDIGTIGATLHGRSKDVMIGKDVRQHRVFKLAAGVTILVLLLSLMATSVAAYYANEQRNVADEQRKEAVRQKDEADRQRQSATEAAERATRAKELETIAKDQETQQREKAENATKNEKAARLTAEERRVEAEHQRNVADEQRHLAEEKTKIALSRQLAAQANEALPNHLDLALLLSVESYRTSPTIEAENSLLSGLEYSPHVAWFARDELGNRNPDILHQVKLSHDGRILVAVRQTTVELWSLANRKRIPFPELAQQSNPHENSITDVAISSSGDLLAIGGHNGIVSLWDVESTKIVWRRHVRYENLSDCEQAAPPADCRIHTTKLRFNESGDKLIAATSAGVVEWNTVGGARRGHLSKDETNIVAGIGPNETVVAYAIEKLMLLGSDGIPLHETSKEKLFNNKLDRLNVLAVTRDGKTAAIGSTEGKVLLWNVEKWEPLTAKPQISIANLSVVTCLDFNDAGNILAIGGPGGLSLWDVNSGKLLHKKFLTNQDGSVVSISQAADAKTLVSSDMVSNDLVNNDVVVWDLSRDIDFPEEEHKACESVDQLIGRQSFKGISFSPDSTTVAFMNDHSITIWDMTSRTKLETKTFDSATFVLKVAFTPLGKWLALAANATSFFELSDDGRTFIANRTQDVKKAGPNDSYLANMTVDGRTVALASKARILLWDRVRHQKIGAIELDPNRAINEWDTLVFSQDGLRLAADNFDGHDIIVWDVAGGNQLQRLKSKDLDNQDEIRFSPDGNKLVTVQGELLVVFDLRTGANRVSKIPNSLDDDIFYRSFSQYGSVAAMATFKSSVIFWDLERSKLLRLLPMGFDGTMASIAFSPNGKSLVLSGSMSDEANVKGLGDAAVFWNLDPAYWTQRACEIANRSLTEEEWTQYVGDTPYRNSCQLRNAGKP